MKPARKILWLRRVSVLSATKKKISSTIWEGKKEEEEEWRLKMNDDVEEQGEREREREGRALVPVIYWFFAFVCYSSMAVKSLLGNSFSFWEFDPSNLSDLPLHTFCCSPLGCTYSPRVYIHLGKKDERWVRIETIDDVASAKHTEIHLFPYTPRSTSWLLFSLFFFCMCFFIQPFILDGLSQIISAF